MPLDVRLKHLIGLVGEILPKPLIYVIPVVGMNQLGESGGQTPMYRSIVQGCGAVRTLQGTSAGCVGPLGFARNQAGVGNVIRLATQVIARTRTKGRRPSESPAGVPADG